MKLPWLDKEDGDWRLIRSAHKNLGKNLLLPRLQLFKSKFRYSVAMSQNAGCLEVPNASKVFFQGVDQAGNIRLRGVKVMRDPDKPAVLKADNRYFDTVLVPERRLQFRPVSLR